MRAFFEGKDWDDNDEFKLKRRLVLASAELLPAFPFLVDDEWDVVPGHTDHGRGDLVFTDGQGSYAVVEVKFIDLLGDGKRGSTKRTSNRKKRRAVEDQAVNYAREVARRESATGVVLAYTFTNESPDAPVEEGRIDGSDTES